MAYVKQNPMMDGMSGSIGKLTFRVRKGKTVSGPKRGPNTTPPTEEQLAVQLKFERCAAYAQEAITNPVTKLLYAEAARASKRGQTAFNAAFQDAATPPGIREIDNADAYEGRVGDVITMMVKDVIRAKSVKVKILSAAGDELEQGDAVPGTGKSYWNYTATVANPALPGTRILVTATDLPGNKTIKEKIIS